MKFNPFTLGELVAELPIIQGGMGVGISLSGLAGSVAAAGGVGILSGAQMGYREADFVRNSAEANRRALFKEIRRAKEIAGGRGIVGINIMVALNNYAEIVRDAVKAGIDLIVCGAGLPLNLPQLVEDAKVKLAPIVSSGRAIKLILKSWMQRYQRLPDMVVVEGALAGGHLGFKREDIVEKRYKPLGELLREVRAELRPIEEARGVSIPVVAAGGIDDGDEAAMLFAAGAAGIQVATPFIATEECDADRRYKEAYVRAGEEDLQIILSPAGLPGRALRSPLIERLERGREAVRYCTRCLAPCDPATTPFCITDALIEAARGNWERGLFFSGAGVGKLKAIVGVKDVIRRYLG